MNKHGKRCVNFVTIFGSTVLLVALLMVGGCGGGDSTPAVVTNSTQLTSANSTLNANGTVTTNAAAPITATTAGGAIAMTIPAGTMITGSSTFTSLPVTMNVTTPVSGVSGMPNPITPGFIISSTAGAVDVNIGGQNSVTFSNPVTINIPVADPTKITNPIIVDMNKNNGAGWQHLPTPGILDSTGKFVTITVNNLCWFGIDDLYQFPSGSTGTGGTGSGGF